MTRTPRRRCPIGAPLTVPLELTSLKSSTRDGRLRPAICWCARPGARIWRRAGHDRGPRLRCPGARRAGSDPAPSLPGQARQGLPSPRRGNCRQARSGNRLVNGGAVIAVDPAYTSRWGAEHWLDARKQISPETSGHHAAALVIGRRGLGHRARRRERCDSTRAVHRDERAAKSVVPGDRRPHTEAEDRKAGGQPRSRRRTLPGKRAPPVDEATEDRSWLPAGQDSVLLGD